MDIFDEVLPLKTQTNAYIRLLMSRVFQKLMKAYKSENLESNVKDNSNENILLNLIKILKDKQKFIYCDEDVYCNGNIDKFWNLEFDENVLGFIDRGICCFDSIIFIHNNYINTGIQQYKILFNILDYIKQINIAIISNNINIYLCHDQFIINHKKHHTIKIDIELYKKHTKNKPNYKLNTLKCIKYQLENYNIYHTYEYKNDIIKIYNNMKINNLI